MAEMADPSEEGLRGPQTEKETAASRFRSARSRMTTRRMEARLANHRPLDAVIDFNEPYHRYVDGGWRCWQSRFGTPSSRIQRCHIW
jgi:hypothetical protein